MSSTIVAPAIGSLSADGSGNVFAETPTSYVINGITHRFTQSIPSSHDLFAAFDITDTEVAAGTSNYTITFDASGFATALAGLMATAVGGSVGSSSIAAGSDLAVGVTLGTNDLDKMLTDEVRGEVEAALGANGVMAFLESNTIANLTLSVGNMAGATDLANKINNEDDLRIMAQQIKKRNAPAALETQLNWDRLPVVAGDKISFVFDLTATINITESSDAALAVDGGAGNASGNGQGIQPANPNAYLPLGANAAAATYASASRRVEFLFTVA